MRPTRRLAAPGESQRPFYLAVVGAWLLGAELVLIATLRGGLPGVLGTAGGGTFVVASGALLYGVGRRDLANRQALRNLLHQHQEALASLAALTDATMAVLPLDQLLDDLLVRLQKVLGVDTAVILLSSGPDTDLVVEAQRGEGAGPPGTKVAADEGLLAQIATSLDPVVAENAESTTEAKFLDGLVSVAGCRIMARQRLLGVCVVGSRTAMPFADRDVQLLQLVADRAGVGIERKMLEGGMREAQRMEAIGQVAGAVAHDFNNLLTVISGYTELLHQRLDADDTNREMLSDISASVARASLLTGQLLTIGRRQTPKPLVIDPVVTLVGLSEVLERILGIDIVVRWALDPAAGNIHMDPAHFEQLILNLAINARDAMPSGGSLEIACRAGSVDSAPDPPGVGMLGPHVHISAADTGTGMDEETLRRCFEPFFTTKERSKGTGMGLATVHEVVAEAGGMIKVRSELDKGTRYDIFLPRCDEPAAAASDEAPPMVERGSETVLVVEDEAEVRRLICQVLDRAGYQVLSAEDGPTALEVSDHWNGSIEMVVTDVVMPTMRGPEVVARLKESRSALAVLFISGDTDGTTETDRVITAAAGFLAKPFKPSELLSRVRDALEENRRRVRSGSPHPEPS